MRSNFGGTIFADDNILKGTQHLLILAFAIRFKTGVGGIRAASNKKTIIWNVCILQRNCWAMSDSRTPVFAPCKINDYEIESTVRGRNEIRSKTESNLVSKFLFFPFKRINLVRGISSKLIPWKFRLFNWVRSQNIVVHRSKHNKKIAPSP